METAAEARTLSEMSNFYCHPGKAGGSLAYASRTLLNASPCGIGLGSNPYADCISQLSLEKVAGKLTRFPRVFTGRPPSAKYKAVRNTVAHALLVENTFDSL